MKNRKLIETDSSLEIADNNVTLSVAVHFFWILTDYLNEQQISSHEFLKKANFDLDLLDDPNKRIPYEEFRRVCNLARDQLNEPTLGIKLGKRVKPSHLGAWGYALMSCSNAEEAMEHCIRYSSIAVEATHITFENRHDEFVRILKSNLPNNQSIGQLQNELSQTILITLVRWFTNEKNLIPKWVSFQHSKPNDISEYENTFKCPIKFDAEETAIAINTFQSNLKLTHSDSQLHSIMEGVCAKLLNEQGHSLEPSWLSITRSTIINSLQQGIPNLEAAAKAACISSEELKRNLAQRGESFRSFVDNLRRGLVMGYIHDPSLSIADIASLLGFSEQSAFQRAFKRWTGETPGEYRKKCDTKI